MRNYFWSYNYFKFHHILHALVLCQRNTRVFLLKLQSIPDVSGFNTLFNSNKFQHNLYIQNTPCLFILKSICLLRMAKTKIIFRTHGPYGSTRMTNRNFGRRIRRKSSLSTRLVLIRFERKFDSFHACDLSTQIFSWVEMSLTRDLC